MKNDVNNVFKEESAGCVSYLNESHWQMQGKVRVQDKIVKLIGSFKAFSLGEKVLSLTEIGK